MNPSMISKKEHPVGTYLNRRQFAALAMHGVVAGDLRNRAVKNRE